MTTQQPCVLIACEFTGTVRRAFRDLGIDAWSCDILPAEDGDKHHFQCDIRTLDLAGVALVIGHPPCNDLASSGAQYWPAKRADGRQQRAIDLFMWLYNAPVPRVAIENPVGIMGTKFRKADQIIQPWQFGEPFNKKTCLWLRGLPALQSTNVVTPTHNWGTNSHRSGVRKKSALPCLHGDTKNRSRSFAGVAQAMADQWGKVLR